MPNGITSPTTGAQPPMKAPIADAAELVDGGVAAEDDEILDDGHAAADGVWLRIDHAVADDAVMADVRCRFMKMHLSPMTVCAAALHGAEVEDDAFADDVVRADDELRVLALVLRCPAADGRARRTG